jgi:hypothetical protein
MIVPLQLDCYDNGICSYASSSFHTIFFHTNIVRTRNNNRHTNCRLNYLYFSRLHESHRLLPAFLPIGSDDAPSSDAAIPLTSLGKIFDAIWLTATVVLLLREPLLPTVGFLVDGFETFFVTSLTSTVANEHYHHGFWRSPL